MSRIQLTRIAVAISIGILPFETVLSQQPAPETTLDEIRVTALRRESVAEKTPISLTALQSADLQRIGVDEIGDLQYRTPGLSTIDSGQSNTRLVIRGVQGVGEPMVGLHYDETSMSGVVGATNDAGGSTPMLTLTDVDRIEVLRGPQGTLYGSGSMTGAVRVLWAKPTQTNEGLARFQATSVDDGSEGWQAEAMANAVLMPDRLAARLVAYAEERAPYINNVYLGNNDIASTKVKGARLAARFNVGESFTLDAGGTWQETKGDIPLWNLGLQPYEANNQARMLNDDEISIATLTGTWILRDKAILVTASRAHREVAQVAADVSYQFLTNIDNPVVCARLRGNGAPCSPATQDAFNAYVRSFIPGVIYPIQDSTSNSVEARVTAESGQRLAWTVGAFYSERTGEMDNSGINADPVTGNLTQPHVYSFRRHANESLEQSAIYGEATWHTTPRLDLTAGVRGFRYERVVGGETTQGLDLINARVLPYQSAASEEEGHVLRFNLAYQATDDVLIYAEASQGYRPGGANQVLNLPSALVSYERDRVWSYELGAKAHWFDNRLGLNTSVFRMEWTDMQVAGSRPDGLFRFISNAGAARAEGVEIEGVGGPWNGFRVSGQITLLDAKLTDDQVSDIVVAPGRKGDRIPYSPKTMGTLAVEQTWNLNSGSKSRLRLEANHVGNSYSEFRPTNVFYREVPEFTLLGARASIVGEDDRWELSAFGSNLTNELAVQSISASGITAGRTLGVTLPPRTIGLEFQVRL